MHKRQQTAPHLILKLVTEYTSKASNLESTLKWRGSCRIVHVEHSGHYFHIGNQATVKLHPAMSRMLYKNTQSSYGMLDTKFGRAKQFISYPESLPTILLNTN